jgi:hypothetical protein
MDGSNDHRSLQQKTASELIWTSNHSFHGWTCSQCEWNSSLPTLLNDPEALTGILSRVPHFSRVFCARSGAFPNPAEPEPKTGSWTFSKTPLNQHQPA